MDLARYKTEKRNGILGLYLNAASGIIPEAAFFVPEITTPEVAIQYRNFGNMDWQVSALGFGLGRLPGEPAFMDEAQSVNILRYAIDRGINYLDLGIADIVPEPEKRPSSNYIIQAFKDGYRRHVMCSLTLPSRQVHTIKDCDLTLNRTIEWLQGEYIDFLVLGNLDRQTWPELEGIGVLSWAEKLIEKGQIGHLGFSFHDDYQSLRTIINAYGKWALCQFRYSFMDVDHHPGSGGLQLAADHGMAVVVSQPLLTGRLVKNIPESVIPIWRNTGGAAMAQEWALRWIWNHPQVSTIVVNMKNMTRLMEAELVADRYSAQNLSIQEEVNISQVREAYLKLKPVNCTGCRSCMPCPANLDIPRILELWNEAIMFEEPAIPQAIYRQEQHRIENCNACGQCTEKCGMKIQIPERLKEARQTLNPGMKKYQ